MRATRILFSIISGIVSACIVFGELSVIGNSASASFTVHRKYVDADATGLANGLTWTDAYTTLQDALTVANSGDEIWVAEGVYFPDEGTGQTNDNRLSTFNMIENVVLYGGFDPGSEIDEFAERDWEIYVTVLSGDIDHETNPDIVDSNGVVTTSKNIKGTNAYHVVFSTNLTEMASLDGFIITAGQATGSWADSCGSSCGGGIFNEVGSPSISNAMLSGNLAWRGGGGIANWGLSNPTINNVTISGNSTSAAGGGGIYNENSNPTIINVTFTNNSGAYYGGGMYNVESNPSITNTIFSNNSAYEGGGMYNRNSIPIITGTTFSNNNASSSGGGGGGMFNMDSDPALTTVTFLDNSTPKNGGGINNRSSNPTLTNVTFKNNSAGNYGGGMWNGVNSNARLYDVTFSNNSASGGGGMANSYSSPTLDNVTISGNIAHTYGGGICNYSDSDPKLTNVAFFNNSAVYGGGMCDFGNDAVLANVIFSTNLAEEGGGIYTYGSNLKVFNVTFTNNVASLTGGGMHNIWESSLILVNTILWGNSAITGTQIYNVNNSVPGISYTLIQSSTVFGVWDTSLGEDEGGNLSADPLFVRNPNDGGDGWGDDLATPNIDEGANDDYGDLRLQPLSPAINSGTNNICPVIDINGRPRPTGITCDIGAYESEFGYRIYFPLVLSWPEQEP